MNRSLSLRSPEPLEARIAPAAIYSVGNPADASDNYGAVASPFHAINGSPMEPVVGTTANGFYLPLAAGDEVRIYNSAMGYQSALKLSAGTAAAFFLDDGDGDVEAREMVGLALGKNASVQARAVYGDVATNLLPNGTLDAAGGLGGPQQGIANISITAGDVTGNIFSGGAILKGYLQGTVQGVFTGTAANGKTFDFNGPVAGGGIALAVVPAARETGPSITNFTVGGVDVIQAGDGGAGGYGGNLRGIRIVADNDGMALLAGNGGDGNAGLGVAFGGTGGSVSDIFVQAPERYLGGFADPTSNDLVHIAAGHGGNGVLAGATAGGGGAGGSLSNVLVGYLATGLPPVSSDLALADNVVVEAGRGGNAVGAATGGPGGSVSGLKVIVTTPDVGAFTSTIQDGEDATRESQLITVDGFNDFTLSFQTTDQSGQLAENATAADVDAALESLTTIQALPGAAGDKVTVVDGPDPHTFEVAFNSYGPQENIARTHIVPFIETDVLRNGTDELQEVQLIDTNGQGGFRLQFEGGITDQFVAGASVDEVRDGLNTLLAIQDAGGVAVIDGGGSGIYRVTFLDPGDRTNITGRPTSEEVVEGAVNTQELQDITVGGGATFTLGFGSETTVEIAFGATPLQVETALNNLTTIQNVGEVTVSDPDGLGGVDYRVQFNDPGDQQALEVTVASPGLGSVAEFHKGTVNTLEQQRLALGAGWGTFVLEYGGTESAALSTEATAAQVDTALDALVGGNGVTVTAIADTLGEFTVVFGDFGDVDQIGGIQYARAFAGDIGAGGSAGQHEIQVVDINGTFTSFTLTFEGASTAALPSAATAAQVQAALNALPTIGGAGLAVAVTQEQGLDGKFFQVEFTSADPTADKSQITAVASADAGFSNEVQVRAGDGGASANGWSGTGGSISGVEVRDFNPVDSALTTDILLQAGAGGAAVGLGYGSAGGSISNPVLLGREFAILAGDGGNGNWVGGRGGSVTGVTFNNESSLVVSTAVEIVAGDGGASAAGYGGSGGGVQTIKLIQADLRDTNPADATLRGVVVAAGDGGAGFNGGGLGGGIGALTIQDVEHVGWEAYAVLTAGDGGACTGPRGNAGAGGAVSQVAAVFGDVRIWVASGRGGNAVGGWGGAGGAISGAGLYTDGVVSGVRADATVAAGAGGDATGANGIGGSGGGATMIDLTADGSALVQAGDGGQSFFATGGRAGVGGSVTQASGLSIFSDSAVNAGDAGAAGASSVYSRGGTLTRVNALAANIVILQAGNGANGGGGGGINGATFAGTALGYSRPDQVYVWGGSGSSSATVAGAGGDIRGLGGTGGLTITMLKAGDVVGGASAQIANGGSISDVKILQTGDYFYIEAGDAVATTTGQRGGTGGSVSYVAAFGALGCVAAGDGGASSAPGGAGGQGGSITEVRVADGIAPLTPNGTIGYLQGATFGQYDMGGLFAGRGGAGGAGGVAGLAGSVTKVSADAIACIVAGRFGVPTVANVVDQIYLNGLKHASRTASPPSLIVDGGDVDFDHYNTADLAGRFNLVGGVLDPAAVDATKFKFTNNVGTPAFELGDMPLDGLVMATTFTQKRNFTPGAIYTPAAGLKDQNV